MSHTEETRTPHTVPPDGDALDQNKFLEKLRKALSHDGDFPTSARIVAELKTVTSNPSTTASQVAEIILREPSLGARVLHMVNSSFYHRGKPIMTITQAVIRIGMQPLAQLCSGLVLLQKFGNISRRGHVFTQVLSQTVVTSLLSSSLSRLASRDARSGDQDESGYLAGSLSEMGLLLLAYYFPEIYENAAKRAEQKRQTIRQCISEIIGISPIQLSLEIIDALHLPEYYRDVLRAAAEGHPPSDTSAFPTERQKIERAAMALSSAQRVSEAVVSGDKSAVDSAMKSLPKELVSQQKEIFGIMAELSSAFDNLCQSVDLHLPQLPQFLNSYSRSNADALPSKEEDKFMQFVEEIRLSVEQREPTAAVITTVMETLVWGLGFDRVVLLLATPGKRSLVGRMALGEVSQFDPRKIERPLGERAPADACEAVAFKESRPVFVGDSVLPNGWPFAAIPVGTGARTIGVIYCDRLSTDGADLTAREQAAVGMLGELLDRSLTQKG